MAAPMRPKPATPTCIAFASRLFARALARRSIAANVCALAGAAETIITSLPTPAALDLTVQAIAGAKVPRRVVVEASTFSLDDKARAQAALRAAGHVLLDCPLSGTGSQARRKDLVIYASGETASIAALQPLFADF